MSKYGFNPKELRKTIITQIDKDGFYNRTVTYGKDSGGSQSGDWPTAKLTFADSNASGAGYFASCPIVADTGFPEIGTAFTMDLVQVNHDNPVTVDVPLFKGACYLPLSVIFSKTIQSMGFVGDSYPELAGNVTFLSDEVFVITGDATITMQSISIGGEPPADEPPAE